MKTRKISIILFVIIAVLLTAKAALGAVVINEVMPDPGASSDSDGEYIELYNDGASTTNIEGWEISDANSAHTIANGSPLEIAAGEFLVLCSNDDKAANGDIGCAYEYASTISLVNAGDTIELKDTSATSIDKVVYTAASFPFTAGTSMELKHHSLNNTNASNWRASTSTMSNGDKGSPGKKNNHAPTFDVSDDTILEDAGLKKYDLHASVSDPEDSKSDLKFVLDSQSNTSLVSCSINATDGHNLECNTKKDQSGESTLNLTVTDTYGDSTKDSFKITVSAVNDKPVITKADNSTATEGLAFTKTITVTDVDNNQSELGINLDKSTVDGKSFTSLGWTSAGLEITGTPKASGDMKVSVVAKDKAADSDAKEFTLSVKPALEINSLTIDEELWVGEEINASPGEGFSVDIGFINNYNKVLGHVKTEAKVSVTGFENMPYKGECAGVGCNKGYWALEEGESADDSFTFQVPYSVSADTFDLTISVSYDNFWSKLFPWWVSGYLHEQKITFKVEKKEAEVHLNSAELSDEVLTCAREPTLDLDLVNTGKNAVSSEVLIFDQKPKEGSFDKKTGTFKEFASKPELNLSILIDKDGKFSQGLSFEDSTNGKHNLYVYIVNPYFNSDEKFIGDSAELEFEVDDCLNVEAIEEELKTNKDSLSSTSVDLFETDEDDEYIYIYEDMDYESVLKFEIDDQDDEIIKCSIDPVTAKLTCAPPILLMAGTSLLEIIIEQGSSDFTEEVEVVVANTLEVTKVLVDAEEISESAETKGTNPMEEFSVELTVKNHLGHAVTGVSATLSSNLFSKDLESKSKNIAADQSETLTFKTTLPENTVAGKYPVSISISGKDFKDNTITQKESFTFDKVVEQESADLKISKVTLDNKEVTCKQETTVTVDLVNLGNNDEDDLVLSVKGGKETFSTEENDVDEILKNGGTLSHVFKLPTSNLSSGTNDLTLEVSYRNGAASVSKKIDSIEKKSCIKKAEPSIADGNGWVISDGQEMNGFEVTLAEKGYDNLIKWFVNGVVDKAQTGTEYIFKQDEVGEYKVNAEINGEKTVVWEVTVTDVPLSVELTTNIDEDATHEDLEVFEDFTVENKYGKIVFNEPVDLTEILDLDQYIKIEADGVSVDTSEDGAPELNVAATVYLKKSFNNPMVLISTNMKKEDFKRCPAEDCKIKSKSGKPVTFTVEGFSKAKVVENVAATPQVSKELLFDNVERGKNYTLDFTVKNLGSHDSLTIDDVKLAGVKTGYGLKLTAVSFPKTLEAGKDVALKLSVLSPKEEASGKKELAKLQIFYDGKIAPLEKAVSFQVKDYLSIDNFEVNGDDNGDLSVKDLNEIEFEVKNSYTEDMEDVEITVEILDVDGDDLEEEVEVDIDKNDEEKVKVEFDLSSEDLDEEEYTVKITINAEAKDDSDHDFETTKTVDLDLNKHEVIIESLTFSQDTLQCPGQNHLLVDLKNVGKSDEDDIEVKVKNSALDLSLSDSNIELDKFSRNDNEYRSTFSITLNEADKTSYPLTVELYRDGKKEESKTATLKLKDCKKLETSSTTQSQNQLTNDNLAKQLQAQLQQQLQAQQVQQVQQQQVPVVKTSFRDSRTYMLLLGVLIFLVFFAMVLAAAVLLVKKK